jgi:hypothetical protein
MSPFTGSFANSLNEIGGFTAPATDSTVDFFAAIVIGLILVFRY